MPRDAVEKGWPGMKRRQGVRVGVFAPWKTRRDGCRNGGDGEKAPGGAEVLPRGSEAARNM